MLIPLLLIRLKYEGSVSSCHVSGKALMYIQCRALLLKVASGRVDVRYNTAAHLPQLEGSGVTRSAIKMAVIYWPFKFND